MHDPLKFFFVVGKKKYSINLKFIESQLESLSDGDDLTFQRRTVTAIKLHDQKNVGKISSVHTAEMIEFEDEKKEKKLKPKVVHDYNNTNGGVDKVDQHFTVYSVARQRAGGAENNISYRIAIVEAK
ncbi:hypothetical protein TNCV_1007961 [Trichonephila clavipes]|nr:hypothetical protein TNCV_1007961 [Trichonephila clavipes]